MAKSKRNIFETSVAVCGGAGFLGSTLVDYLIDERKCNVIVLDNLVSGYKKFVNPKAKFIHFDITGSEDDLRKIFIEHNVRYVFNYVAEPFIPVSFKRPLYVFNVNAFGAMKVINASQEAGVEAILQVSSAEIYGNSDGKLKEDTKLEPHSTYGVSKVAIDGLVQVAWKERKTPVLSMRQFNCYGPRETHEYIVPVIIEQIAKNGNKIKLGNNSTRDFQYSCDSVKIATELLENGEFGEVYNMGSEQSIKIYDLAQLIGKIMGFDNVEIEVDPARLRPWEIWHLQSDNTKLNSVISYRAETPFEEGLKKTIEYYYTNGQKWDYQI